MLIFCEFVQKHLKKLRMTQQYSSSIWGFLHFGRNDKTAFIWGLLQLYCTLSTNENPSASFLGTSLYKGGCFIVSIWPLAMLGRNDKQRYFLNDRKRVNVEMKGWDALLCCFFHQLHLYCFFSHYQFTMVSHSYLVFSLYKNASLREA